MLDVSSENLLHSVFHTLAYSDVFDYPLTAGEVYCYLTSMSASLEEVTQALADETLFTRVGNYFTLRGREEIARTRKRRAEVANQLWPKAARYGRIIAMLPFVRMVAVTGSLSMNNTAEDQDVDYLIVTAPDRLWLCRALSILVARFAKLEGVTLCPNYLVTTNALELQERSLYVAHELAQMIPLAGMEIYYRMCRLNRWVADYLPNAAFMPERFQVVKPVQTPARLQRALEILLSLPFGNWLEKWEMNRKIARLRREQSASFESYFSADVCKGHIDRHRQKTEDVLIERLRILPALIPREVTMLPGRLPLPFALSGAPAETKRGEGRGEGVLLGQSYFLRFDPKLWEALQPYPPLGTLYAASYLRQHGYEVALFDAMLAESEEEWGEALDEHQPQYAILYEDNFNYLSKMCLLRMREAAFRMIDMAKSRGCTVILCGADATDHYQIYLLRGADYVLIGEGEETLIELLGQLSAGGAADLKSILGLAYQTSGDNPKSSMVRGPSSIVHHNPRRPDISNLDALPFPAWDLVDVETYRAIWLKRHGYFSMNMVTTRGCPFHCNWCAKPIWGQRYHSRSPENVAAEMKWLQETYHPDHIWFADDILGLKPGWLPRFADALHAHYSPDALREGSLIPFKCLSRADLLTRPGEVEALARVGAQTVWMGAESGSQRILDAMDKGTRVEQIHEAARRLKRAKIRVGFFLQFGYPGETREDIELTIQLMRDADPDDIGISVSYPMPGTKFYEAVRDQLGEKQNWHDSDDLAMLYQGPFSTEFYRKLHSVVHKEFRARKAWKSLRSPRAVARLGYNLLTLPFARMQLNSLASKSQVTLASLPHMPHEAAATPTPQEEQ